MASVCLPVSYTHLDVYKRQILGTYFDDDEKKKKRQVMTNELLIAI